MHAFRGKDRRWWHAGARTRTRCESKEPPSSMHLDAVAFEDDIEKPPRRRAKANEARHSYILIIMQYESCNYFTHARTRKPDVPIRCDAHSVFLCTNGTHACTPSPSLLTATPHPSNFQIFSRIFPWIFTKWCQQIRFGARSPTPTRA